MSDYQLLKKDYFHGATEMGICILFILTSISNGSEAEIVTIKKEHKTLSSKFGNANLLETLHWKTEK